MSDPDDTGTTSTARPRPAAARPAALGSLRTAMGRRWVQVTVAAVVLLVAAAVIADNVELNYYVVSPGLAQPVGPLVKVPPSRDHRIHGRVLLTDVYITRVSALSYVFDELRPNAQVVPAMTVLGPATPPSQLAAQGYLEMAQSQAAAKVAALTRLGYHVGVRHIGTIVFAVVPASPASRVLSVGQTVTSVDGRPTPDACAFAQAMAAHRAGQRVTLDVQRSRVTSRAAVVAGATVRRTVTLGRWPSGVRRPAATPACPHVTSASQGYLGVEAETRDAFRFPFPVSLRTTSIGGPSAGLAMTLGIVDALGSGHLTGGRTIAATGTITPTGAVGEVGGVPQKTVAVEAAGATVFFVPAAQVGTARSKATRSLRVYGVRTLTQVLSILRKLGGSVPRPGASRSLSAVGGA